MDVKSGFATRIMFIFTPLVDGTPLFATLNSLIYKAASLALEIVN
ncbi:hypothetical protein CASFOL_017101 [Castilleja foliolosa]|uniref:Uncharacterized protein n=1 Tax=Castilleja foliolosa TaxID=1961234 RepID=A0ABD3DBG4_9LAMI